MAVVLPDEEATDDGAVARRGDAGGPPLVPPWLLAVAWRLVAGVLRRRRSTRTPGRRHRRRGEPTTVGLLTYDSFALPEEAAAAFERRTGATIEVVATGDSGSMLDRGAADRRAPPRATCIFGIDNTSATRATGGGPAGAGRRRAALDDVPDRATACGRPAATCWSPIDTGDVCVNVDAAWFAEHGPRAARRPSTS